MKSREDLVKEVEALRRKISPLENKEFTADLDKRMEKLGLSKYQRDFRGAPHIVLDPVVIWQEVFGGRPNRHDIMVLGRSLQALLWERSAINGARVFVKTLEEYENE